MRTAYFVPILSLALIGTACESATAPAADPAYVSTLAMSHASAQTAAAGNFNQNAITGLQVRQAGSNTILEQTSAGSVSGTLSGSYTDDIRIVIHPNGRFTAQFTIRCECTVAGEYGVVEFVASDRGEIVNPDLAAFAGRATITGGTADLSDLQGVLEIEGTVDLNSGLSQYSYTGWIR